MDDALRQFALILTALLALLVLIEMYWLIRHRPWALPMMVAQMSIFFFNLAAGYSSYVNMGTNGDGVVLVRLLGHALGVLTILVSFSVRYDRRRDNSCPPR